ncbi:TPA: hypothetical protein DIV48_03465 [Candidatus Kaiserbacteria bacterium]|nr:MAG: hypothetical protein UY93_C0001G0079 [Parcubacteria group bacterium GW2011_GWA1_56_13]HCR52671.1 hypothetical protein [Candidatus Kaiserbacteria bacterium]
MTRFPAIVFIALALFVGVAGAAPATHAQTTCTNVGSSCTTADGSIGTCASDPDTNGLYCLSSAYGTATANNPGGSVDKAAAATPKALPPDPDMSKGFGTIMTWIMSLFAWLVGVAAITLDYAVYYTVVTMGDYVNKLSAVGVTWRIMRDFGNIALIFGFLAAGIMTILNVDWYGFGKKMLPMLVVSAVLLNFSLFAAEAVIDAGNLFATQFYTQIKGGTVPSQVSLSQTTIENEGISNKIMAQLGLQTIYTAGRVNTEVYKAGNTWLIGFMGIILFTITAFVMFSLAFILIARFVILLVLIIVAPLGFAGLAIPKLKSVADKWWAALFEQTITAPVLLLLLYVALAVITDAQFLTGLCGGGTCSKNWIGFVNGNDLAGFASMILSFLVAMGLLLAVVVASKKLSAFGGDWAIKSAGKLSFGATAWAGRNTVGWGAQGLSQYIRRSRIGGTKAGRLFATAADYGAKGSFDVRGATLFGGLKAVGVDAGKAQDGGYRGRRERAMKGHEDYVKSIGKAYSEQGATAKQQRALAEEQARAKDVGERAKADKAEAERLQKIYDTNRQKGILTDQQTINELNAAKGRRDASAAEAEAAQIRLKTAKDEVDRANKGVSDAERNAKLGYAENINRSVLGWALFGPGGSASARKIIKDATKDPNKQILDTLRKVVEDQEQPKEEKKSEEPKAPGT